MESKTIIVSISSSKLVTDADNIPITLYPISERDRQRELLTELLLEQSETA